MKILLFLNMAFSTIRTLNKNDIYLRDGVETQKDQTSLNYHEPFLIFLFFERKDYNCPLCLDFKNYLLENLKNINMNIRQINFIDNVNLASRFLIHTFPAFIIRHKNRSYVLNPEGPEDLFNILNNKEWTDYQPVRESIDVTSCFAAVCGRINQFIFYFLDLYYNVVNYIPSSIISLTTVLVIAFLIYSIYDVIKTPDVKIKVD